MIVAAAPKAISAAINSLHISVLPSDARGASDYNHAVIKGDFSNYAESNAGSLVLYLL